ncbi:hypothetical protein C8Q74DRAFT_1363938 [Fomes fomentarius]|nr:hypothetical protein C8Q74DRAFT_1363938 [Fomes fomentarius]
MTVVFAPLPGRYAVMRVNPTATLEQYGYEDLLAAAAKDIQPKSYLQLTLPFPNKPWYPMRVSPIAPCLGPIDDKTGMTADMCIPIYPNTNHPTARAPVHTEAEFPYNNCYHWSRAQLNVRIRCPPEMFDIDHAVKLPVTSKIELFHLRSIDYLRMEEFEKLHQIPAFGAQVVASPTRLTSENLSTHEIAEDSAVECALDPQVNEEGRHPSTAEETSSNVSGNSSNSVNEIVSELVGMGIFGDPNTNMDLYPVVDIWFDLTSHLRQEEIPNPIALYKECEKVTAYVPFSTLR